MVWGYVGVSILMAVAWMVLARRSVAKPTFLRKTLLYFGTAVISILCALTGNLVIYSSNGSSMWNANVNTPGAVTVIQNDGNVVIYDMSRNALWDSYGYTGHQAVRAG